MTDAPYRLLGGPGSPYSLKLRAALRYRRLPHHWIVPTGYLNSPGSELAKAGKATIPVLQFPEDGSYHADTTPLIYALEARHPGQRSLIPDDPADAFLAHLIEDFADEFLVNALFVFRWVSPEDLAFSPRRQLQGWLGTMPAAQFEAFVAKFMERQTAQIPIAGGGPGNKPLLEMFYRELLDAIETLVTESRYLFGTRPSLAEIGRAIVPPIMLIVAVLGAILGGIATPTEAASVGAVGAILMGGARQGMSAKIVIAAAGALILLAIAAGVAPVRLQRSDVTLVGWVQGAFYAALALGGIAAVIASLRRLHGAGLLKPAMTSTMTVTAMIFATILTASIFSLVFIGLGGEERIEQILTAMPGGPTGALIFSMAMIFVLGFFLDFVEITVILLPLITPALILMGHDPYWLAILIAINLQTSFLTPPFGFSLFYLRGAAPPEVTTGQIYAGVAPFILLQLIAITIVWLAPPIATWLPALIF